MEIFRVKHRNENGVIVKTREYVGVDNLRIYGKETYNRYNNFAKGELWEYKHHHVVKWVQITDPERIRILFD